MALADKDEFKKEMQRKKKEAQEIQEEERAQQKVIDDITSKLHTEPDPKKRRKLTDLLKSKRAKHAK